MKKTTVIAALFCTLALLLSACGSSSAAPRSDPGSELPAASGEPADQTAEAAPEQTQTEAPAEPAAPGGEAYAWMGLSEMPRCPYLDALASSHYLREYVYISTGNVYSETVLAVDGVNRYCGTDTLRSYSVDGVSVGINDSALYYVEKEDHDSGSEAAQELARAMSSGENLSGRAFAQTGRGPVPAGYDYFFDDTSDYDYYEYYYPVEEEYGLHKIERYYMRNGDVFAIYYEQSFSGEILGSYTEVNQSISTALPEGIFELPDLAGYTKDVG